MRKSDIEKLAKRKRSEQRDGVANKTQVKQILPESPREAGQEREERGPINLSPESCKAIGEAVAVEVCARLARLLPVIARIAAADTLHTCAGAPTVLGHAIDEGIAAANLMESKL